MVIEGEGYRLETENLEGFIFLHIYLQKWGPGVVKGLRTHVDFLKDKYLSEGHDVIFASTESKKILKLWEMVEPCYQIVPLEDKGWLGSWLTEEI